MAMLSAIEAIDLTDEQRSKFDALSTGLNTRLQEIMGKINAESEKMRKLQEEQMRLGKTLTDLRGHMMQAIMDAANRAEELLTDEQRQALIGQGGHIMMPPGSLPYGASQGGKSE
jgi:predicted transcriptional regulator